MTLNSDSIYYPPNLSLVLKQGLSSDMMGYFVFRTGSYSIFDWGKGYEDIHGSSCTLGINRKLSKSAYDAKVTAGSAASQINFSIVQPVAKGVKGTFQVSMSTAHGFKSSVLATKRITKGTKLSFGIEVAQAMGVTLQLRYILVITKVYRLRHLGRYLSVPILISDEIRAGIIAGALMIPLIGSFLIDNFYLIPKRQASTKKRLAELRESNANILNQRQGEAAEAIDFMRLSVTKKIDHELSKNGLIIVEALYGILPPSNMKRIPSRLEKKLSENDNLYSNFIATDNTARFIDVTIPIQNQVSNSQLFISGGFSKSNMIGFYDPCLGEKKRLRVKYRFQEKIHWVEIGDRETLALPLREHQIS